MDVYWAWICSMTRMNIEIDANICGAVMREYNLANEEEAISYALSVLIEKVFSSKYPDLRGDSERGGDVEALSAFGCGEKW